MKDIVISINEEVCKNLETLHYNYFSKRDILSYMIANNYDTQSANFKEYEADCRTAFSTYEIAKQQFQKEYIDSIVAEHDMRNATWSIDFDTCTATISN